MRDSQEKTPLANAVDFDDEKTEPVRHAKPVFQRLRLYVFYTLAIFAACSLPVWQYVRLSSELSNLKAAYVELVDQHAKNLAHVHVEYTPYARLTYDMHSAITNLTEFSQVDKQDQKNELWNSIDLNLGVIALSHEYSQKMELPLGLPFPWDETKSLYQLNAYHLLHCVKKIQRAIVHYRYGLPQANSETHTAHCLDAIRRDIICQADDTPWATGAPGTPPPDPPQQRKCRNFAELQDWAIQRNGCYDYNAAEDNDKSLSFKDRYRFCPPGSPYFFRNFEHEET
ncbi:MAG: hypothetical protein MMC33_003591 [Icmadophila ericetorum]|nr:hypothetical protein [Icmadophila ericetorum]